MSLSGHFPSPEGEFLCHASLGMAKVFSVSTKWALNSSRKASLEYCWAVGNSPLWSAAHADRMMRMSWPVLEVVEAFPLSESLLSVWRKTPTTQPPPIGG